MVFPPTFSESGALLPKRLALPRDQPRASLVSQESRRGHNSHAEFSFSGPGFGIYAVVHLLLPVMSLWLRRSHKDHSYWDVASANFKHAIGLSCELVVEHIQSFIHSGRYLWCPSSWRGIFI